MQGRPTHQLGDGSQIGTALGSQCQVQRKVRFVGTEGLGARHRPRPAAHQIVEANPLTGGPQLGLAWQVGRADSLLHGQLEVGRRRGDDLAQSLLELIHPRLDGSRRRSCRRPERQPAALVEGHPQRQALGWPELGQEGLEPLLAAVPQAS